MQGKDLIEYAKREGYPLTEYVQDLSVRVWRAQNIFYADAKGAEGVYESEILDLETELRIYLEVLDKSNYEYFIAKFLHVSVSIIVNTLQLPF